MNAFDLKIWSVEKELFSGKACDLNVTAIDGSLEILPGHVPYINAVKEGQVRFRNEQGRVVKLNTAGGFLKVTPDHSVLLFVEPL